MMEFTTKLWRGSTYIRCLRGDEYTNYATGFFFGLDNNTIFLVTNRHVINPNFLDKDSSRTDKLELKLHTSSIDLTQQTSKSIELSTKENTNWFVHPDPKVDLVLVDVSDIVEDCFIFAYDYTAIPPKNLFLPPGENLVVLGYPKEFYDKVYNLPIARNATLASHYSTPFENNKYFLIDSFLHEGTSGSPVITKWEPTVTVDEKTNKLRYNYKNIRSYLLGIHSEEEPLPEEVRSREDRGEGVFNLNRVWYSYLILEILDAMSEKM